MRLLDVVLDGSESCPTENGCRVRVLPRLTYDGRNEVSKMNASISIGVLAQLTGCTVPTIRYYEEIELLPAGPRTDAGRRVYGESAVKRLTFIRRCRDFGFSIDQVRELVGLVDQPDRPCVEVRDIASGHLDEVRKKLAELQALESSLSAFVVGCDTACAGGASVDCTILEDLAHAAAAARRVTPSSCCVPAVRADGATPC
jgi:DNA-binding transcriptional MerR regulator